MSPVAHSDEGANDTEVAGPGTILAYSVRKPLFNDGQLPGAMVDVDNEPVPDTWEWDIPPPDRVFPL